MYVLDRYEPMHLSEHINKDAIDTIQQWYNNGHKKPLLIYGTTGVGKSTLVRLFSKEKNLTLYELTPSDARDKESIEQQSRVVANSRSIFAKKNLLFFDNIDVFFGDDRGGLDTIVEIASDATNPVIFVAADIYADKKLSKIRDISESFNMKKPTYLVISNLLKRICIKEKIICDEEVLKSIAQEAEGDIRSAILDLDVLRFYGINKKNLELLGKRERKHDVFKTVLGLFKARTLKEAIEIRDSSDLDYDMLYGWVTENLHLFYNPDNLKVAYDFASVGDVNRARIYLRQNWTFLKYFLVLGIIAPTIYSKKDTFNFRIAFPTFISKMGKETSLYAKNKKASTILQKFLHVSRRRIVSDLEFYKQIFSETETFIELTKHTSDDEKEFIIEFFELPKEFKKLGWAPEAIVDSAKSEKIKPNVVKLEPKVVLKSEPKETKPEKKTIKESKKKELEKKENQKTLSHFIKHS